MFPLPILTWIKIAAVVLALSFAYYKGYSGEHEKFLKFQAEVTAVGKAQEVINLAKVKEHETISTAITNQYEARLAAVHNYYADRVQRSPSSSNVSTVPNTAVCANASATDAGLVGRCAQTTLQLTELQNWIKSIK